MTGEFLVGWSTFDPRLRKPDGFITFVVVDDYTAFCLWDLLLCQGIPQIGSRPKEVEKFPELPVGNWDMHNAMHTMATTELYAKGGITKPAFEQLPAVYALTHGKPTGKYILNATLANAVEFMKEQIEA